MAATVGATLAGVAFPDRHTNLGPFKSSGGNYYFFGRDTTDVGGMEPQKATAPMTSFTAGTSRVMSSGTSTSIQAAACYRVADVIHCATQISTGAVYYNSFNMATDAWALVSSEVAVAAAAQAPVTNTTFVDLVVRSNGEVVIIYNAGQTAMSSTFNMVRYVRRTGTNTYSTPVNVDNGGSVNWLGGIAALGASDRVHFFLKSGTGTAYYQRTLTAANALETFPASLGTSTGSTTMGSANALSYVDAGTTKVRALYNGPLVSATAKSSVARLDSADAPTVSKTDAASDAELASNSSQMRHHLAVDGTSLHLLYSDQSATDLFHDASTDGGTTWGTDTNEFTGTVNRITATVYDRSGTKLAMVLDDAATLKYAEISLGAAAQTVNLALQSIAGSLLTPTVTPGAVTQTLALQTVAASLRTVTETNIPPARTENLALQTVTASLRNTTVTPGAVSTPLALQTAAAALLTPTVTPGAVSQNLALQAVAAALRNITETPGGVSTPLALQAATATLQNITVTPGAVTVPLALQTAAASLRTVTDTTSAGGQTVNLALQTVAASLRTVTETPGAVSTSLALQTIAAALRNVTETPGAVSTPLALQTVAAALRNLTEIPGAVSVPLALQTAAASLRNITETPGAVTQNLALQALAATLRTATDTATSTVILPLLSLTGSLVETLQAQDTSLHVSFPTPTVAPSGQEEFQIEVRRTGSGGINPQVQILLYENGSYVATALGPTPVTSTTSQIVRGVWDASSLTNPDGSGVEALIVGTALESGNQVEIGAVAWNDTPFGGALTTNLALLTASATLRTPTIIPGAVSQALALQILAGTALTPAVIPGAVSTPLALQAIAAALRTATDSTTIPGVTGETLALQTLTATLRNTTVVPGAISQVLALQVLTAALRTATDSTTIPGVLETLALQTLAASLRNTTVVPGAVTQGLAVQALAAALRNVTVSGGAVLHWPVMSVEQESVPELTVVRS